MGGLKAYERNVKNQLLIFTIPLIKFFTKNYNTVLIAVMQEVKYIDNLAAVHLLELAIKRDVHGLL